MQKRRIPVAAAAVLALGGGVAACDDEKKVDTSAAGVSRVARSYCQLYQECYPTDFRAEWSSVDSCAADYTAQWERYRGVVTADCFSAAIAYYDCVSHLECTEIDDDADGDGLIDKCEAQEQKFDTHCDGAYATSGSPASALRERARLRIPR